MGQNLDLRKVEDSDKLINEKSNFFDIIPKVFKMANNFYLDHYYVYEKVINEVKPDLFFCYFVSEVCHDMAWKLKKPTVTLVGAPMG